ncbi:MAG: hypothetical protein RIF36_24925 [Imperialibacter sp.]|uniref:hypothetical protein n=1 Tax=Imperialibacter sp. TaxID=2038411 RepID=UPI0032EC40B1
MRDGTTFILLMLTLSCQAPKADVRDELNGMWVYNPEFLVGDTVSSTIEENFEPQAVVVDEYLIATDSGYYEHHYENSRLTNISKRSELWIQELIFQTDSAGTVLYYDLDTAVDYKEHPRIFASNLSFQIVATDDGLMLIAKDLNYLDTASIVEFSGDRLVLLDKHGHKEAMTRLKEL